jgi:hypothetical protein
VVDDPDWESNNGLALCFCFRAGGQRRPLVPKLSRDQDPDDSCFAKRLAGFEPMESLDQNEAAFVGSNENGSLLSDFQNTSRDLVNEFRLDCFLLL